MVRKKQVRKEETAVLSNTFDQSFSPRGDWRKHYFHNSNPLVLELGCGKGDYTIELARRFPEKNFIGIDIKGSRIWTGAAAAMEEQLHNVGFLRIRIEYIEEYFNENEVDEIWITFPDPFIKRKSSHRRLTSPPFLQRYRTFLKPNGTLHLKTDDETLFSFTLKTLQDEKCSLNIKSKNLHTDYPDDELLGITTTYEKRHLKAGKTIKYVCFSLAKTNDHRP